MDHDALLRDIFEARLDLAELGAAHAMSPAELAAWIGDDTNRRALAGLCQLADLQTQLMLSRYRQVAVTELIKQATGGSGDAPVSAEQARKACVDLLKAELQRAKGPDGAAEGAGGAEAEVLALRAAWYGDDEAEV